MGHDARKRRVARRQSVRARDISARIEEHGHPVAGSSPCHLIGGQPVSPMDLDPAGALGVCCCDDLLDPAPVCDRVDEDVPEPLLRCACRNLRHGVVGDGVALDRGRHQHGTMDPGFGGPGGPPGDGFLRVLADPGAPRRFPDVRGNPRSRTPSGCPPVPCDVGEGADQAVQVWLPVVRRAPPPTERGRGGSAGAGSGIASIPWPASSPLPVPCQVQ